MGFFSGAVARVERFAGYRCRLHGLEDATRREFVQVDELGVTLEIKKGVESVTWSELQKVRIATTNEGPWVEDVCFLLEADGKGCAVPHSAAVRIKLLEELQVRLPGFRDDKVIEAMGSTDNNNFTIWERPGARAVQQPVAAVRDR